MNNKDLIKQYVNTGVRLPDYQISRLLPNDLKSYLRVRMVAGELDSTEFNLLDEVEKDNYIQNLKYYELEESFHSMYKDKPIDDYIMRFIKLRSPSDIKNNISTMMYYADPELIYKIIDEVGPIFGGEGNVYELIKHFDTDEEQLEFAIKLMNTNLANAQDGFNRTNSPMIELLYYLDLQPEFIKYVFDTNIKLNGGKKIKLDDRTFLGLFDKINEENMEFLIQYLEKYVKLDSSQLNYIQEMKDDYNL